MCKAISGSTEAIFMIFFHQMEGICVNFLDLSQFSDSSMDVAMATNFVAKLPSPQHLSLWHFETEWDIATSMCALINSVNDASI